MSGDSCAILSLNTWDLPGVCERRSERVRAIAEYLSTCTADVVLLQEVWVPADVAQLVVAAAKAGLKHSQHFQAGTIGTGLVTLSRYRIVESLYWCYSVRGYPTALHCEFYTGKGVGLVRLQLPCGRQLHVLNTHLHANWEHCSVAVGPGCPWKVPLDRYAPVRATQMLELCNFVRMAAAIAAPTAGVVLGGDLNCPPDSLEVGLLRYLLPELHDAWARTHPGSPGWTIGDPANRFTHSSIGVLGNYQPQRIDYIFSTLPAHHARVVLEHTPNGYPLSDHNGLLVKLGLTHPAAAAAPLRVSWPCADAGLGFAAHSARSGAQPQAELRVQQSDCPAAAQPQEESARLLQDDRSESLGCRGCHNPCCRTMRPQLPAAAQAVCFAGISWLQPHCPSSAPQPTAASSAGLHALLHAALLAVQRGLGRSCARRRQLLTGSAVLFLLSLCSLAVSAAPRRAAPGLLRCADFSLLLAALTLTTTLLLLAACALLFAAVAGESALQQAFQQKATWIRRRLACLGDPTAMPPLCPTAATAPLPLY